MNNKRGLIFKLLIILVILFVIGFFLMKGFVKEKIDNLGLNCVPATCCHPTSCVQEGQEENCAAVQCSADCEPGTLDCNQARCEAIKGKCEVILNS